MIIDESFQYDAISHLRKKPFSTLSFVEKQNTIDTGRPTPHLDIIQPCKAGFVRHFKVECYDRHEWLTGSTENNRLYCWPCLLSILEKGVWNEKGYNDLNNLTKSSKKHGLSQTHIHAMILPQTFGRTRIDILHDTQCQKSFEIRNQKVKENREVMRRLIDAVYFLGKQELPF